MGVLDVIWGCSLQPHVDSLKTDLQLFGYPNIDNIYLNSRMVLSMVSGSSLRDVYGDGDTTVALGAWAVTKGVQLDDFPVGHFQLSTEATSLRMTCRSFDLVAVFAARTDQM